MRNYCNSLFGFLLIGLFSFSEGKPCPERTRPHKTRCDVYYKCTELTASKHVWVPTLCDEGLVYEHSLSVCVLPADDWECQMGTNLDINKEQRPTNLSRNRNADIFLLSNAEEEEDISLSSKYDEGKMEIIIGPDISDEDKEEEDVGEAEEGLYDGSGNGSELVELDGFMPAKTHNAEIGDVPVQKKEEEQNKEQQVQKMEQKEELAEMFQSLKTKADIRQPSTNIDPKLTAHLQRLSQLIDGLKQTYQKPTDKSQDELSLKPHQLNAFLAHFNIRNKVDFLGPTSTNSNATLEYEREKYTKLNPETKVVLSKISPHHDSGSKSDNGNSGVVYSNSQIVVNRPEGSVLLSLPEHDYMEHPKYSSDNTPKISEETLKTVLELSKQMIAQQNVPKIISNPTYYAQPLMQPILLTPHVDSPFSTNYIAQNSNSPGFAGQHNYNQNYKRKKMQKNPHYDSDNNVYSGTDNDNYDTDDNNDYSNNKPGTTIIHNNLIPIHLTTASSDEKEILDSYGQSLGLYAPLHDANSGYHDNSNSQNNYSSRFENKKYSASTTKRPSHISISAISNPYGATSRPLEFQATSSTINQYFTPTEHLGNHNVNNIFSSIDNYGSIPRPMKGKKPTLQNYKPPQENGDNKNGYSSPNQLFVQANSNKVHAKPNPQNLESFESENNDILNNYQDDNNDQESQLITYTYGKKKKPGQQTQFSNYGDNDLQTPLNTVFSTNMNYISKPQTNSHNSMMSSNSYYSSGKNKYTAISSPITSNYGEGTQLVNVGGNFISIDAFQNSILPLVGDNVAGLSSSLNNVEVITCATGVRQPNITDCTRYYVCSKKDGKVLSYSCPPYTAFNSDTRICDAKTYAICINDPIVPTYSVYENKRHQMETLKAIQQAQRHQMLQQKQQQQATKAQNMANILQHYGPFSSSPFNNLQTQLASTGDDSSEQNVLNPYMQQAASMSQ